MKHFGAPWSKTLVAVSVFTTLLCVVISFFPWNIVGPAAMRLPWLRAVPVLLVAFSALFTIRGYVVTADAVLVQRLFWNTRLPLAGLERVELLPEAMRGSIRLCGNGGMFSFSGFYRNRALGSYRAYVTDMKNTVVLYYVTRRVVVSPAETEGFVAEVGRNLHAG